MTFSAAYRWNRSIDAMAQRKMEKRYFTVNRNGKWVRNRFFASISSDPTVTDDDP